MNNLKGNTQERKAADLFRGELRRVRYRRAYMKMLSNTLTTLLLIAALMLSAVAFLPVIRITGDSMANTLQRGDILVAQRTEEVRRGDLIVFYVEGNKMLVKRAIALGGDQVQIDQDGTVMVNGQVLSEAYVSSKSLGECDLEFPFVVPNGRTFVLGDHREVSIDSRSTAMGCIAEEQIIGRAAWRIWPLRTFGLFRRDAAEGRGE